MAYAENTFNKTESDPSSVMHPLGQQPDNRKAKPDARAETVAVTLLLLDQIQ